MRMQKLSLFWTCILVAFPVWSAPYKEGDPLETFEIIDQFDKPWTVGENARFLLLSFEMGMSKKLHQALHRSEQPAILENNQTDYVTDITNMPALITLMFAGPKMRKYPFRILLARDKTFAERFPSEFGYFTLLRLNPDHTIARILYLENPQEIFEAITTPQEEN